jgi:hypothetical protein
VRLLPAEQHDVQLEPARATATPPRASRGSAVRLTVAGLRPESEEGPVDLTIYVPDPQGWPLPSAPANSQRYVVVVEHTLHVRGGNAGYTFRTVRRDQTGRYVAVFRRTDCSSRPVARTAFELV